ncbi:CvpA family protein [Chloroflexota bacterium]
MNWLDIVILVVGVVVIYFGSRIGIIKAVLSLAGVIVGIILAGRYYVPLSEQLSFISQASVSNIIAFAIILIGVMTIAGVLTVLLKWAASAMLLGWVNRLGGAVFSLALGAMFCGALLATWVKFFGTELVIESLLAKALLDKFPLVLGLLPQEFDAIRAFFQ